MCISESAPKQTPHTLQRHPTVRLCAFSTQNSYYGALSYILSRRTGGMGARPVGVVARTPRTPLARLTSRKRAPPVRRDRGGGTSSQHRLGEKAASHARHYCLLRRRITLHVHVQPTIAQGGDAEGRDDGGDDGGCIGFICLGHLWKAQ